MKTKAVSLICATAFLWCTSLPVCAEGRHDPVEITADVILVRPVCLAATVVGSAVWVLGLPIAALSKSVKTSGKALVVKPAQATFTRPLGEMDALAD